jgi:hypothetical protein
MTETIRRSSDMTALSRPRCQQDYKEDGRHGAACTVPKSKNQRVI